MTKEKVKVLITENAYYKTGAFNSIMFFSEKLKDEFEFVFILPKGSSCVQVLSEKFKVYELPFIEISKRWSDILTYLPMLLINGYRLRRIAVKEKALILHSNDLYNLSCYSAKLFGLKIPVLVHIRMMPASFPGFLYSFWKFIHCKLADELICVSEAVAGSFNKKRKCTVIYDIVKMEEKLPFFIHRDDLVVKVLYLSNYIEGKGQDDAISAFLEAKKEYPNMTLTFVGGDMGFKKNHFYRLNLEKHVKDLKAEDSIFFKGAVDDIEKIMKDFDIALNFSRSESFSLTCLEALYFGTPLIATDSGGPSELFENGVSGLLVPVKNFTRMKEAIVKLAKDPELRKKLRNEGRTYVRRKFINDNGPQRLKNIYLELKHKNLPYGINKLQ
jgi:L-malate glycosyltransferase